MSTPDDTIETPPIVADDHVSIPAADIDSTPKPPPVADAPIVNEGFHARTRGELLALCIEEFPNECHE
jgi:hypothetical protein